jgi:integrase
LRPRTRDAYRWALDRHVLPRFEHRRVASLTEEDVAELLAGMRAKPYSSSTMQAVVLPLSQVLAHAVRRGITNPLDRLDPSKRPHKARREKRCLDRIEIAALLDAAEDPGLRTLLALSVSTGLRQGESLGLRWADLDLAANMLRVRWQLGRDGKLAEPKTGQAKREVDLAPSLVSMLREHKLASLHSQPGEYVFAQADGSPLHYRAAVRALEAAAAKANLNPDGVPKLRWHDLRHTCASVWIAAGLNVHYVSNRLGHSQPSITLDVYAHEFGRAEHAERARSAMDAALAAGSERVARGPKTEAKPARLEPVKMAQLGQKPVTGN